MNKEVLIADDNYICVEGIQHSISWKELGISKVHSVYDGTSAFEYLKEHPVDILVSDISMPGMAGLELSEKALALNPSLKIILISAYDEFEYAKKAVRLGAFDYIEKPINYDYLTEILRKALAEIEQESQNLEILKKSRPAMEEQFFRSLIQSNYPERDETLKMYAQYLQLELDCSYCTALCLSIEDAPLLKQTLGIEEYCVRLMSIESAIRNLQSEFSVYYVLKDLTGFICILGGKEPSNKAFKEHILSSFSPIIEQFSSRCTLVAGLGTITGSIWELPASYINAQKALEYRFFFPEQHFLEVTAISRYGSEIILEKNVSEDELIQYICKNNLSGVKEWIHSFIHSFPGSCDSKIIVYSRLYTVIARLLKFSYELNIITPSFEEELTSAFSNPNRFKTIGMISDWLLSICQNICARLQDSVSKYHESLCEAAVHYIQANYGNSELGLNEIAASLQISPAYLSTLFKQYRNQNISAFLTDTRIDAACHLLENTNLSLKVISTQVGYSNQYYFSSCFKKKMGVTPSAYRDTV